MIPKKGGKEEDNEDDPIAKSLKERMDAGGLSEVVQKGAKPNVGRRPSMIKGVSNEEEKKGA